MLNHVIQQSTEADMPSKSIWLFNFLHIYAIPCQMLEIPFGWYSSFIGSFFCLCNENILRIYCPLYLFLLNAPFSIPILEVPVLLKTKKFSNTNSQLMIWSHWFSVPLLESGICWKNTGSQITCLVWHLLLTVSSFSIWTMSWPVSSFWEDFSSMIFSGCLPLML